MPLWPIAWGEYPAPARIRLIQSRASDGLRWLLEKAMLASGHHHGHFWTYALVSAKICGIGMPSLGCLLVDTILNTAFRDVRSILFVFYGDY